MGSKKKNQTNKQNQQQKQKTFVPIVSQVLCQFRWNLV